MPFFPYAKQSIRDVDIQAVEEALKSDIITRGRKVEAFEDAIARYCGVQYAVAFNNGTSALMGAYFAAEFSAHDRVISSPNSFIATVGVPIQSGNYPHFVDIDCSTGNLDVEKLKLHLDFQSSRGRLFVVPVHFAGIAVDMAAINQLLYRHPNAIIIEDAAQALGSSYSNGSKVGSCAWSHMTIFSFHPAKIITTGEGGVVTTNDPHLYERLKLYRNNGIVRNLPDSQEVEKYPGYYEVQALTGNFNFTDFQAALGLSQLRHLETFIEKRRHLIKAYRNFLHNMPGVRFLSNQFDNQTAFHLCVIQIDFEFYKTTRIKVINQLLALDIGTQVHYIPLYRHPVIAQHQKGLEECFPEMERYYAQALSLPLYSDLKESDVEKICKQLKSVLKVKG